MKKQLPPPTPPYTGGETNARNCFNATMKRVLPLCKGELEGVVLMSARADIDKAPRQGSITLQTL